MKNTSNFKKWAKDKPPLLAVIAHSQVHMAKVASKLINMVHDEDMMFGRDLSPDLDTWLKLFRSHSNGNGYMLQLFNYPSGAMENLQDVPYQLLEEENGLENFKPRNEEKLLEEYLNSLNIPEQEFEKVNSIEDIKEIFLSPEFYFFFRVQAPCWLMYYTTPAQLLREARQHDFKSLIRLIKLDSSTIFDRKISRYIHELRSKNRSRFEQVQEALKSPLGKMSHKKMKIFYAAMITQFSIALGHRLKEPDIRELFDAIARDEGRILVDPDIPDSPHTFYMAIKRLLPPSD